MLVCIPCSPYFIHLSPWVQGGGLGRCMCVTVIFLDSIWLRTFSHSIKSTTFIVCTVWWFFFIWMHPWDHRPDQDTENVHHHKNFPCVTSQSISPLQANFCHYRVVLLVLKLHMTGITLCVCVYVCVHITLLIHSPVDVFENISEVILLYHPPLIQNHWLNSTNITK